MAATSILGAGLAVALFVGGCNGDGEGPTDRRPRRRRRRRWRRRRRLIPLAAEEAAVSEAAEQARLRAINAW